MAEKMENKKMNALWGRISRDFDAVDNIEVALDSAARAAKMTAALTDAIIVPAFQPGALTHCNEAAYHVANILGIDLGPYMNKDASGNPQFNNTTANAFLGHLADAVSKGDPNIHQVDGQQAQALANEGQPCISGKQGAIHGHVGWVAPHDGSYDSKAGPWIGNVGKFNGFMSARDAYGSLNDISYYCFDKSSG